MALIKCPECGREISSTVLECPHCHNIICPECGNAIKDNVCVSCGYQLKQNKIKSIKIILCFILAIVIILVISMFVYKSLSVNRFVSLVERERRNEAVTLYNDSIKGDTKKEKKANKIFVDKVNNIYNNFKKEKILYTDAIKGINLYVGYTVEEGHIEKTLNSIDNLDTSRKAFESAKEAQKNNNLSIAIADYSKVIKDDENYTIAVSEITQLKNTYREQSLKKAQEYVNSKEYTKAVNQVNEAISVLGSDTELSQLKEQYTKLDCEKYVKVTVVDKGILPKNTDLWRFSDYVTFKFQLLNNSDKEVKGVEGSLIIKDLFGKEIMTVLCDFTGMIIAPGNTYNENNLTFECNPFKDTDMKLYNTKYEDLKFEYKVKSVVFSDGTIINPDY